MISDDFGVVLTPSPKNPILSDFRLCPYFMMSDFDPQTPIETMQTPISNIFYRRFPKFTTFFTFLAEKILSAKVPIKFVIKILWVEEVNSFLKRLFL